MCLAVLRITEHDIKIFTLGLEVDQLVREFTDLPELPCETVHKYL